MSTTYSGETCRCPRCEKQYPIEEGQTVCDDDGPWCPACVAEWDAHFAACQHSWEPHHGTWGPGQVCTKCSGFMEDQDFAERFPAEAERMSAEAAKGGE